MSFKVTLIVESTHDGSEHTMKKTIEGGSDNERFYPSQVEHVGVALIRWAEGTMTSLVGGRANTLIDHDAKMVVNQRAHLDALQQAQAFRDLEQANAGRVFISKDALKEFSARDEELSRLELGGPHEHSLAALRQRSDVLEQIESGSRMVIDAEELAALQRTHVEVVALRKRDALLRAMEAAGVDNWEGMEHVERPED